MPRLLKMVHLCSSLIHQSLLLVLDFSSRKYPSLFLIPLLFPLTSHSPMVMIYPCNCSKKWGFLDVDLDTFTNHVVVNVGSLVSRNKNLGLNSSGKKLQSWVDYDCTSKRLEVRVSELGGTRPYGPLLVYNVDLGNMWKGQQVLVGLTSNGSSLEGTSVYSWKFSVRSVPKWLHSQPVDPNKMANRKRFRLFPSCLIFVTGCLALASLVGLFLWVIFSINNTEVVIPAKRDFRYEKVANVVVEEDGSGHVKN
ncbi:L-type lectin-domain containing receptor kinase S.4-like [Lycium ferocissimum]|uniref:L-type lectin-domain containing receptor kinase S.4-like n=1 Tax=Lycium ferocissimum TaxID=112874 RepID=UPI0028157CC2|nr:L-type lectin-domain containing receptor kinase S.4-like [Lycium ferocissimum]